MVSTPAWVDSHAHLSLFPREEVPAVLARAAAAGVGGVLVPASGGTDLDAVVSLTAEHPQRLVAAVGVHPHEASTLDSRLKRRVERAVTGQGVVALGEIGLDYHYLSSPREDQLRAFAWQLELAAERNLPVILHNRDSWADLEATLAARAGSVRGVCHSFCEGPIEAHRLVELGLVIGVSGMVTFPWADRIRQALREVGWRSLLVETDSPYLAPSPHRGQRNEPAHVALVGRRVAAEVGIDPVELQTTTTAACRALFALAESWPVPWGAADERELGIT